MHENSCMARFAGKLEEQGYDSIKVKPAEIGVYYKMENRFLQVVLNIDYHQNFVMAPDQLKKMKHHLDEIFMEQGLTAIGYSAKKDLDIRIFTVFWGEHFKGIRDLMQSDPDCWYVDAVQKKLLIYENQRGDFYGIRRLLEEALADMPSQRVSGNVGFKNKPWKPERDIRTYSILNMAFVAANVLVFVILEFLGDTYDAGFMMDHGGMYPDAVITGHQYYRLFTSMFIHFGISHIGNNMFILFFLGDNLERAAGHVRYLLIYLLSGLGGSLLSCYYMVRTGDQAVAGGASGAIFGVIGALLYVVIRNKGKLENLTAKRLAFMAALSLYYGFSSTGVDNQAHIGGFVTGFILAVLLYHKKAEKQGSGRAAAD